MASGREAHRAAQAALSALGKDLSRRARSGCELCGEAEGCRPHIVPPIDELPQLDTAILACPRCREALEGRHLPGTPDDYRFLLTPIWSELAVIQVAAVRLLRRVAKQAQWAEQSNEELWLDDEIAARVEAS